MSIKIIILVSYATLIVFFGILGLKKTKSFSDFFLGGRSVGPWMSAFTYGTAYFSAVLFIGFAGKIGWAFGYSSLWIALGNGVVGVFLVWKLMGYRIRRLSQEMNVQTVPEFFEKRYSSPFLKLFSALCIFVFFIPYSAAVFIGLSYLFTATFNLEYWHALLFMGAFTALYLSLGGYKSMTMIDVIFGVIMIVGVTILYYSTVDKGGGLSVITANLSEIDPKLTSWVGPPGVWPLFCLVFLTSVAPFAMPQLVQKFYAIKDERAVKVGTIASTLFAFLITGVAYFVGSTARVLLSPKSNALAFENGKPLFDALMPELLANVIPNSLSVLILILILSASMSTLAALVLISSSAVSKDIYAGFINKNADDKKLTKLMRIFSVLFVLLSVVLAYFKPSTIVTILAVSWGAIGSVFLGPFIYGIFSKNTKKGAAIFSSIAGLAVCLLLYMTGTSSPQAGTLGMFSSLLGVPVFWGIQRFFKI